MKPPLTLLTCLVVLAGWMIAPAHAGTESSFGNSLNLRPAPDEPLATRIAREREAWLRQRQADKLRRQLDRLGSEIASTVLVQEIDSARRELLLAQQQHAALVRQRLLLASMDPEHRNVTLVVAGLERELDRAAVDPRRPDYPQLTRLAIPLMQQRAILRKIESRFLAEDPQVLLARDAMMAAGDRLRELLRDRSDAVQADGAWQDVRRRLSDHQQAIR